MPSPPRFIERRVFTPSPHLLPGLQHLPEFGTLGPRVCEESICSVVPLSGPIVFR